LSAGGSDGQQGKKRFKKGLVPARDPGHTGEDFTSKVVGKKPARDKEGNRVAQAKKFRLGRIQRSLKDAAKGKVIWNLWAQAAVVG